MGCEQLELDDSPTFVEPIVTGTAYGHINPFMSLKVKNPSETTCNFSTEALFGTSETPLGSHEGSLPAHAHTDITLPLNPITFENPFDEFIKVNLYTDGMFVTDSNYPISIFPKGEEDQPIIPEDLLNVIIIGGLMVVAGILASFG